MMVGDGFSLLVATLIVAAAPTVQGAQLEVALVGLFSRKAVLVVGDGKLRTLSVGEVSPEGVQLVAIGADAVVVEMDGRRVKLRLGDGAVRQGSIGREVYHLQVDTQGHFAALGWINGSSARMVVDTGATLVSLGTNEARRLGLDYTAGEPVKTMTASGVTRGWRIQLDSVAIGGLKLHGVDAVVLESDLPFVLLGMSFLNRTQWQRDGDRLMLQKRY